MSETGYDFYTREFTKLRILNTDSAILQQQSIVEPYSVITEWFDVEKRLWTVEMLDSHSSQKHQFSGREYRRFVERPPHTHNYLEVMLVLSGLVRNDIEQESFVYRAAQGCIMNSHIRHREVPVSDGEVVFIELTDAFLRELLETSEKEKAHLRNPELSAFLKVSCGLSGEDTYVKRYFDFSPSGTEGSPLPAQELVCAAVKALREHRPGSGYLIRAAILNLFYELGDASRYRLMSFSSSLGHREFLVSKMDFLISASHGRIEKRELERQLSYNGDYLNRIYKEQRGLSVSQACREALLRDAKRLLKSSDLSVEEIMDALGVTSRGYFFSLVRSGTDMTPKEYRQKSRENAE